MAPGFVEIMSKPYLLQYASHKKRWNTYIMAEKGAEVDNYM